MKPVAALIVATALASCAGRSSGTSPVALPSTTAAIGTPQATSFVDRLIPRPPRDVRRAVVVHVTDGDTIVLRGIEDGEIHRATGGRKARLIGVDTPEVFGGAECYGQQASAFTKRELDGATVLVDFDVGRTDRYGRALVYVWQTDGRFFNARLVREGYALQLTVPPNVRYAALFTTLVRAARNANRGLWAGC